MTLQSIDNRIAGRLKSDREFRKEWYRAELEYGIPEQFRSLREFRDLTQAELANMIGMKQSAVSRFEKSTEPNWKFETLLRIADALDAQLVVGLEKSEDVIKRFEREELQAQPKPAIAETAQIVDRQNIQYIHQEGRLNETAKHSRKHDNVIVSGGAYAVQAQHARQAGRALSI